MFGFKKWYIVHEDLKNPENGIAYFGPFSAREIDNRLNDYYADLLAGGSSLDAVRLSRREVKKIGYINPREYWMEQLAEYDQAEEVTVELTYSDGLQVSWVISPAQAEKVAQLLGDYSMKA